MNDNSGKGGLYWFKWTVADDDVCRASIDDMHMGKLHYAVMDYVRTGQRQELPESIRFAYDMFCAKVDIARKAYQSKVEKLAENGAKGGRKKAENAKRKEAERAIFTPPTKTEFRNMAKHYKSSADLEFDAHELDQFYNELAEADWAIGGVKIESMEVLVDALSARFCPYVPIKPNTRSWRYFQKVFQITGGNIEIWGMFEDCYDEESQYWTVDGTTYQNPAAALDAILAKASDA